MSWNLQNKFGEFQHRLSKNGFKGANAGFSSGSFALEGDRKTACLSNEELNIHNQKDLKDSILMKSKSGPKYQHKHRGKDQPGTIE